MKSLFRLLLGLLLPGLLLAQNTLIINGKIVEQGSLKSIPNAFVGLPSKGTGTLANTEGDFILKIPAINHGENLVVSVLGYKNLAKKVADFEAGMIDTLLLEPTPIVLLDTAYTNHVSPKKMVADALFRVKANYQTNAFMLTGFYQETLWRDSAFVKITEGILKTEKNPTPPAKIPDDFMPEKIKLIKGRKFEKTDQTVGLEDFGFGNGPAIVTHSLEIALPEYLEGKNFDDYEYKLDSILTSYNDKPVFVFRFSPSGKKVKAAREGQIYVDTTSRAIVGIAYEFTPEGMKDVIKSTFKSVFGGLKTDVKKVAGQYRYHPFGGKWYLQDSQLLLEADLKKGKDFQAFASIHLSFVTNEVALKYSPPIKIEEHLQSTENFSRAGGKYDEVYWGNFNCIKPTETMREIVKRPIGQRKNQ